MPQLHLLKFLGSRVRLCFVDDAYFLFWLSLVKRFCVQLLL